MPPSQSTFVSGGHNFYVLSDHAGSDAYQAWVQEIVVCRAWLFGPVQALSLGLRSFLPPPTPQCESQ